MNKIMSSKLGITLAIIYLITKIFASIAGVWYIIYGSHVGLRIAIAGVLTLYYNVKANNDE